MSKTRRFGAGLLSEDKIPRGLADKGVYRPAGYACRECDFFSKKKGFPGRQALRAHLKKHKNERRAWQRPLILQTAVVMMLLGAAIAGWLEARLPFDLPFDTPLLTLPGGITKWAVVGIIAPLLVLSLAMTFSGKEKYWDKTVARLLGLLVFVGSQAGLGAVAMIWGIVSPELSWPFQVPLWALVVLTP